MEKLDELLEKLCEASERYGTAVEDEGDSEGSRYMEVEAIKTEIKDYLKDEGG